MPDQSLYLIVLRFMKAMGNKNGLEPPHFRVVGQRAPTETSSRPRNMSKLDETNPVLCEHESIETEPYTVRYKLKKGWYFTFCIFTVIILFLRRKSVADHSARWGSIFDIPCKMIASSATGILETCLCRVSVRKVS